jgi:hypothetical protein
MADEVNYGTARATDPDDTEELSKAELQRRMEEARESISQTVAEIKDTVVNQYQSVRETVAETLDWREQYRKRPIAWSLGALGVGLIVGYAVGGAFGGDDGEYDYDEQRRALSPEDTRIFNMPPSSLEHSSYAAPRSYAAQAITGGAYGSSAYAGSGVETEYDEQRAAPPAARGGYSSGGGSETEQQQEEEAEQGPGLLERFRETKAYDRLQQEVSTLGDRFIEELSKTAQTVILPALFSKVKDLFGVDISGRKSPQGGRGGSSGGGDRGGSESASNAGAGYGDGMSTSGGGAGAATSGSSSYATSANQPYGDRAGNG